MPLLFSLAIHDALVAVQAELREGEVLFAYLDDVYAVTGAGCWHSVAHREDSVMEQIGQLSSQHGRSGRAGLEKGSRYWACQWGLINSCRTS